MNFAIADWISAGGTFQILLSYKFTFLQEKIFLFSLILAAEAETRYRLFARESVFSYQRLLFTLLQHANEMRSGLKRCVCFEFYLYVA